MTNRKDWFSPFASGLICILVGWVISYFYDGVQSLIVGIPLAAVVFSIILILDSFKSVFEFIELIKIVPTALGASCGIMIQSGNEKAFTLGFLISVLYLYTTYDLAGFNKRFRN